MLLVRWSVWAATASVGIPYSIIVHVRLVVLLFLRLPLRYLANVRIVMFRKNHQGCWLANPLSLPNLPPSLSPSNAPPCPLPLAHPPPEAHRVPPLPKVRITAAQEIRLYVSLNACVIIIAISRTLIGYKQKLAVPDTDPFEPLEKEYRLSILEPRDDTSSTTSSEGSSDDPKVGERPWFNTSTSFQVSQSQLGIFRT